ncbi:MAG: hypothetical protein HYZ17_10325 [Betaproteobacteria bacterium]|nr:hypothetical protein [Betaproteobacteria bacterium]
MIRLHPNLCSVFWLGVRLCALGALAWQPAASLGADPVDAGKIRWRLATSWSAATPVLGEVATRLATELRVASQGRLELRVEEPGYHKSPQGVLDMVRSGTHEIGFTASHFPRGRESPLAFFAALDYGLSEAERLAWHYGGGGLKRLHDALALQGLHAYPVGNTFLERGLWSRRELKSAEDLRGLRLRVPGDPGAALRRLGVRAVNVPVGELAEALAQGRVDALEWPAAAEAAISAWPGAYFYGGWQDPAAEVVLLINREKMAALPADLQLLLNLSIKALASDLMGAALRHYEVRLEGLAKSRAQLRSLPRELAQALREANDEALREYASRSSELDDALQARQAFLARWRDWARPTNAGGLSGRQAGTE